MGRNDPWQYAEVDLATDSTTVFAAPCLFKHVTVTAALSAHACPIVDGATTVFSIPASAAIGAYYPVGGDEGVLFQGGLIVNPNDAATGTIVVVYKPLFK